MNIGLNITQPNNIVLILGDASPFEWEMKHQAVIFSPVENQLVGLKTASTVADNLTVGCKPFDESIIRHFMQSMQSNSQSR